MGITRPFSMVTTYLFTARSRCWGVSSLDVRDGMLQIRLSRAKLIKIHQLYFHERFPVTSVTSQERTSAGICEFYVRVNLGAALRGFSRTTRCSRLSFQTVRDGMLQIRLSHAKSIKIHQLYFRQRFPVTSVTSQERTSAGICEFYVRVNLGAALRGFSRTTRCRYNSDRDNCRLAKIRSVLGFGLRTAALVILRNARRQER